MVSISFTDELELDLETEIKNFMRYQGCIKYTMNQYRRKSERYYTTINGKRQLKREEEFKTAKDRLSITCLTKIREYEAMLNAIHSKNSPLDNLCKAVNADEVVDKPKKTRFRLIKGKKS